MRRQDGIDEKAGRAGRSVSNAWPIFERSNHFKILVSSSASG